MTCVYLLSQAKFELKDSSIQPKYCLICCLQALAFANALNNFLLKDKSFYQQLPVYVWSKIASLTLYLSENEAENLQNGNVHFARIPDLEMGYLENHLGN